jgi:hypothetical protein
VGIDGNNDEVFVDDTNDDYYEVITDDGNTPVNAIIVTSSRRWESITINDAEPSGDNWQLELDADIGSPSSFSADRGEVFTMEAVGFKFAGTDADANGICDSGEVFPFVPDCTVQRAEAVTNTPPATTFLDNEYDVYASNVYSLLIQYYAGDGSELTSFPLDAIARARVSKITITIVTAERGPKGGENVGEIQKITMKSSIMIRNEPFNESF